MTQMRRFTLLLALAMIFLSMVSGLCLGAEQYPTRPIQVIVPFAPGGAVDLLARSVEKIWPKYSSQPMLVINKAGSGGIMGAEYVVRAKPDGYTVLIGHGGVNLTMPHLQKIPFDTLKDIAPVSRLTINPVVICVGGKSPFNSMTDLITWAHKGNRITAAVSTALGTVDLVMRAISKRADIAITTVPFSGGAESTTALAGGHLVFGGGLPPEVMPHIKAGRFKAIGVALPVRSPILPKVPTLQEQGINVATWGAVYGTGVPTGTPPDIIEYLSSTLKKVCEDAEYKKSMASLYQPVMYQDTKEWTAFLQRAYKDYGDLIKELDIKI
jgi:tripartite-type tricarboxylate transporter receptor subunit TctC